MKNKFRRKIKGSIVNIKRKRSKKKTNLKIHKIVSNLFDETYLKQVRKEKKSRDKKTRLL